MRIVCVFVGLAEVESPNYMNSALMRKFQHFAECIGPFGM
jgi:hypothetical protein